MSVMTYPLSTLENCDRCGEWSEKVYDVTHPSWKIFAREGERVLCERCLKTDSHYMATYPWAGERGSENGNGSLL